MKELIVKKTVIFFIILITVSAMVFFSYEKIVDSWFFPKGDEPFKLPQEFSFQVPEMDSLFITTRKIANEPIGASFYVIFSKDSLANPSDNQDYVKFEIEDGGITIVLNPNKKNNIYIKEPYKYDDLESVNVVNYNLQILERKEFNTLFYEPQIKTDPLILKYPYIEIHISTMSHLIFETKYSLGQTKIK
jgi:hypothetical protein